MVVSDRNRRAGDTLSVSPLARRDNSAFVHPSFRKPSCTSRRDRASRIFRVSAP